MIIRNAKSWFLLLIYDLVIDVEAEGGVLMVDLLVFWKYFAQIYFQLLKWVNKSTYRFL